VTYVVRQLFRYEYTGPAYDLRHRLVVIPRARHGSLRRRAHSVEVSAAQARQGARRDRHGNLVVHVELAVVPAVLELSVTAVVERSGPVTDATLPLSALSDPRLLRPTRLTAADDRITAMAARIAAAGGAALAFAERCCQEVRQHISYAADATTTATTAAQALAGGRGVCQDHAHLMLALCRAAGVPARYVSGHLLGDGGTHAWVEVVVADGPRARAVAFDPCNGCRAGARHLTVATGRDYTDVAPTSGYYSGEAAGRLWASKQVGVTAAA